MPRKKTHKVMSGARVTLALLPSCNCVSKEEMFKARANVVRGGIAGVHGHFQEQASRICLEMPDAETALVPPMSKTCSRGCQCASSPGVDSKPGSRYDCEQWSSPEWQMLKFAGMYTLDGKVSPTVHFHHQARWHRTDRGCRLEFTVYGDLDEDGVYSTYTATIETGPGGTKGNWPDESLLWE